MKINCCFIVVSCAKMAMLKSHQGFLFIDMLRRAILAMVCVGLWAADSALGGTYLNSAHGNTTYGVNRTSTSALGYVTGNCAHCHEQHGTISGSEPAPVGGAPSSSALFYDNNASQADNLCLQCHVDIESVQINTPVNRSFSFRAGGWTLDTVNDVKESFAFSSPGTSHNLNDIKNFIAGRWGYSTNPAPCAACHNPHATQGDPANAGNSVKSAGTRGYPASRPSQCSSDSTAWGVWGDTASEKMSNYDADYQAPYRYNSVVLFEPLGDATKITSAQSTVDYVSLCTDCHNATNTIYSTTLGRNLLTINWTSAMHGKAAANSDAAPDVTPPYTDANLGTYALNCTDCHEPHGSSNRYLIRKEVNGQVPVTVSTLTSTTPGPDGTCNKDWVYLCGKCHTKLGGSDGHVHPFYIPPDTSGCSVGACHSGACIYTPCGTCHMHGQRTVFGTDYGQELF